MESRNSIGSGGFIHRRDRRSQTPEVSRFDFVACDSISIHRARWSVACSWPPRQQRSRVRPEASCHPAKIAPRNRYGRATRSFGMQTSGSRDYVRRRAKRILDSGRTKCNHYIHNCFKCKRLRAVPKPPLMSALLRHRVHPGPSAFANVGVDYFGPILVTVVSSCC